MPSMRGARLAVALLVALAGCTGSEVKPGEFTVQPAPGKKSKDGAAKASETLEAASVACKEQADKEGIKSLAAIFSRLRPGQAERAYAACMSERGFEVAD